MLGNLIKDLTRKFHIAYLHIKGEKCGELHSENIGQVVIVAPHPDDEVIGCGGLIARLVAYGRAPHIIIITGGEGSHRGCCETSTDEIIHARRKLTRNALAILGVPDKNIHELNFSDGNISMDSEYVSVLKDLLTKLAPDSIFIPHWGEGWSDHVKTAEIVKAIKPEGAEVWEYCVWMWYYNVWRGLDWKNTAILRMSHKEHKLKLKAIDAYTRPLAPCGHPWSGVLPDIFLQANSKNRELFFKIK